MAACAGGVLLDELEAFAAHLDESAAAE
jgi:hypothetical protein